MKMRNFLILVMFLTLLMTFGCSTITTSSSEHQGMEQHQAGIIKMEKSQ